MPKAQSRAIHWPALVAITQRSPGPEIRGSGPCRWRGSL